ncbi:retrovirus-related pol polyprotein from transposon TNT 1-94 [Tanacetum coccineum]
MSTMAENVIAARADNHPSILDKSQYNSWQSRMLLYIQGKENGKQLYDSVINGPFQYGTIEVLATPTLLQTTRPRTYKDLTEAEKIREAYDIRATNIVLQDLPLNVYCLVNHHTVAKEIWDKFKLHIEGVNRNMGTNIANQAKVIQCYNCQGEGHMARQCTKPKRPKNSEWFKEKMLLAQAQEVGVVLDEEQLVFLVDDGARAATVQTLKSGQLLLSSRLMILMHSTQTVMKHHQQVQFSWPNSLLMIHMCLELEAELSKKNDMVEKAVYNELSNKWMYKLDLQPLSPKLRKNMEDHADYLKQTKEHADTLHDIVEQARALQPLDSTLDYALNSSTYAGRSKPKGNTRNNRISRTSSSNLKNKKVEDHPRNAKTSLNKKNHVFDCIASTMHVVLNANFEFVCFTCNECLFNVCHDLCVVDYFNAVNSYTRAKSGKSNKKNEWKPIEGLRHNLFLVGQFCEVDLEVAFSKHWCFVHDQKGVDLLKGLRGINLYTFSLEEMMKSSPIFLLSKDSKTKLWLWHRRLSHLNFDTINKLVKQGLVRGLPKFKYKKDPLCSAYSLVKSKKHTHKPKSENFIQEKLYLLHMDLCGLMRIEIINVQVRLIATVRNISTDNGTEFVNQMLKAYYEDAGISHQTTVARTPQQNGVPSLSFVSCVLPVIALIPADTTGTPSSTTLDQDAPFASTSPTTHETQSLVIHPGVEEHIQEIEIA